MVKSKNIIAGLGVVAGLGMALMPLGVFAEGEPSDETDGHVVRAHVGEVIEIDVTNITNRMSDTTTDALYNHSRVSLTPGGEVDATTVHTVAVKSNARGGYQLLMKANTADLRLITEYNTNGTAKTYSSDIKIAGLEGASSPLTADASGWGYKIKKSTDSDYSGDYLKVPAAYDTTAAATIASGSYRTGGTGATAYRTETSEYTDTYNVQFGIKAASTQPSGSYESTITYKAIAHVLGDE